MIDPISNLRKHAMETGSILCFGVDPLPSMFSSHPKSEDVLDYFIPICESLIDENLISAVKPNSAYFLRFGMEGFSALISIFGFLKNRIPTILDAKVGDIGRSSEAYADWAFDVVGADYITVSPYMGEDSVMPFFRDNHMPYILCRTTNLGAKDFQELDTGGFRLFEKVSMATSKWGTCGFVVGAFPDILSTVGNITNWKCPFLIPGIGRQGGDARLCASSLKGDVYIHRFSSSSSIALAEKKYKLGVVKSALTEAKNLLSQIKKGLDI